MKNGGGVILLVAVTIAILVGAFWIGAPGGDGPLDPESHEPNGTSALVALLEELGAEVEVNATAPGPDTDVTLLLRDRLGSDARVDLRRWVQEGGTLVAADPGSQLTPPYRAEELGDPVLGDSIDPGSVELDPDVCDVGPIDNLSEIEVYAGAVLYDVSLRDESCYGDGDAAYVVATPRGDGTVVALGGTGILLNRSLGDRDNAPLIAALVAPEPGTRVALLDPLAVAPGEEGGDESLWDLVPDGWKLAMLQLGIAFVVYVLWRARRLGRPVDETQPVKVASAELVAAVGGLLERSGSPQHAAEVLRADLRRELAARMGLARNVDPAKLVEILTDRTTLDPARLQAAIGPGPVTTDNDLLAVAQLIDVVRKEVFEHVGS